jgi:hypothetical protein
MILKIVAQISQKDRPDPDQSHISDGKSELINSPRPESERKYDKSNRPRCFVQIEKVTECMSRAGVSDDPVIEVAVQSTAPPHA